MAYRQNIAEDIPVSVGRAIKNLHDEGMEADVIVGAIEQTGWAERPSPQYLRAILSRYQRQGIRTMADVDADRGGRQSRGRPSAGRYLQHDYTDADFGAGFFYNLDSDLMEV